MVLKAQSSKPTVIHVKKFPELISYIGRHKNLDTVSIKELKQFDTLYIKAGKTPFYFKVISFEVTLSTTNGLKIISVIGNKLSEDVRNGLIKISPGTKIYFDNIKTKGVDGKVRNASGMTLVIKGKEIIYDY